MQKHMKEIALGGVLCTCAAMMLPAQTSTSAALPDAPAAAVKSADSKELMTVGWDQRWRSENWNNLFDSNDAYNDQRIQNTFRQRLWMEVPLGSKQNIFYLRLLNQVTKQEKNGTTTAASRKLNSGEYIVDNLYFDFKQFFSPQLSFTVGRRDMQNFGEGFLVFDGSAGDGPRTNYFNMADLTWRTKDRKQSVDAMFILDPRQERFFPVVHNQNTYMNEWNEKGMVLYYQNRERKDMRYDVYYIWKEETDDYRAKTKTQFMPNRSIHSIGGRFLGDWKNGVSVVAEGTGQFGHQDANASQTFNAQAKAIHAFGAFGYATKSWSVRHLDPYVTVGYYALSGNDWKNKTAFTGFDPLFSRWPKWSGGYVWSLNYEIGAAYWTNLKMQRYEVGMKPFKSLKLSETFWKLGAFHPYTAAVDNAANDATSTAYTENIFSQTGTDRGLMPIFLANYKFSPNLFGEFRWENTLPGNYFNSTSTNHYFRFEVNYTLPHVIRR